MNNQWWEINIQPEFMVNEEIVTALQRAIVATLEYEQVMPPAGVSLLLTDDTTLQNLNREFRGYDQVTDVLSFPAGVPNYLGDIAISVPQATRQAEKAGHAPAGEMLLLAVHGTLHLLGHDHSDGNEKATMWAAQTAILNQLKIFVTLPQ